MKNVIYANVISEARLRKIIQEELQRKYLIEEGLWDDVKDGVKKLSNYVSEKFKSAANEWANTISEKIEALTNKPEELDLVMSAIKQGVAASGDSIVLNDILKMAKELSKESALDVVQSDLEGPVKDKAKKLQTGAALGEAYSILTTNEYINHQKILRETGIEMIAGFGLAIVGGLPLLFKGLFKLANFLNAPKAAALFKKAEHVTHAIEEKVIDYIVPDALSYQIYKFLNNKQAEFRFTVYDLLNQNNSVSRTNTDSYIQDSQTNVLNRYYMLSFTYNFKKYFAKKEGSAVEPTDGKKNRKE
jgi:hypothetical protein